MNQSEKIGNLLVAIANTSYKIGPVLKTLKNDYFKSSYAGLTDIDDKINEYLKKEGLSLVFGFRTVEARNAFFGLITWHGDKASQNESLEQEFMLPDDDIQKQMAASTYLRRYMITVLFRLSAEDDDGESAVGRGSKGKTKERTNEQRNSKSSRNNNRDNTESDNDNSKRTFKRRTFKKR